VSDDSTVRRLIVDAKEMGHLLGDKSFLGQLSATDTLQFLRIHSTFFCTDLSMSSFDYEKVAVFFILYSNSPQQEKIGELFQLMATDLKEGKGIFRIVNDDSGKLDRIFSIMIYLTCRMSIENVLRDEHRRKTLGKLTVEIMTDLYNMCN